MARMGTTPELSAIHKPLAPHSPPPQPYKLKPVHRALRRPHTRLQEQVLRQARHRPLVADNVSDGVDQGEVREGLREVAEVAT